MSAASEDPQRFQRLRELFEAAQDLPAAERVAFIDRKCQSDSELRARLDALLAQTANADASCELTAIARGLGAAREAGIPAFPGLEVLAEIAPGIGGMGRVFRARETSLERMVAVKVLRACRDHASGRDQFVREARAVAALEHPHIIRIHRFEPDHETPFFVMEHVDGTTLAEACRGQPPRTTVLLLEKVARAVHYAHGRRVVHGDLKPDNVLVDRDGEPKVVDFGLARRLDRTTDAINGGTPVFLAPEAWLDTEQTGPPADVYALGVSMYVLLTGSLPFPGRDPSTLRAQALAGSPPLLLEHAPDLAEPLQRICLQAMEREAEHRYASAGEFADDLRRWLEGREVRARPQRYREELAGRLNSHLAEIRQWGEQRLVGIDDVDRLQRPYRRLLDDDSPWPRLARQTPAGAMLIRLGGWLIVLACALWLGIYWHRLDAATRLLGVGAPALLLNCFGWYARRRGSTADATAFLTGGALLGPLLLIVLLTEVGLLQFLQSEQRELCGEDFVHRSLLVRDAPGLPSGWAMARWPDLTRDIAFDEFGERDPWRLSSTEKTELEALVRQRVLATPGEFRASNAQLTISAFGFLAYSLLLLVVLRTRSFAALTAIGAYLLLASCLLLVGLREWIERERHLPIAVGAALVLAGAFAVVARRLVGVAQGRWSPVLHAFFPVPAAALLTLLAYTGTAEFVVGRYGVKIDQEELQIWMMANGPIYLVLGLASLRARAAHVRFWAPFFMLLFPLSLMVPCHLLFARGPALFPLGREAVTAYALLAVVLPAAFLWLGPRLRSGSLVLSGLAGLTASLWRFSERHLEDWVLWPPVLALLGTLALAAGAMITRARQGSLETVAVSHAAGVQRPEDRAHRGTETDSQQPLRPH